MFCNSCGAEMPDDATLCTQCGKNPHGNYEQKIKTVKPDDEYSHAKSRIIAGLLQIFLGYFGAGRFYLGYTSIAVSQIFINFFSRGLGIIWPVIDGIGILCGKVKTDANGNPVI